MSKSKKKSSQNYPKVPECPGVKPPQTPKVPKTSCPKPPQAGKRNE